ncbi:hypothetical protein MyNCGM683_15540 [Achromobacter xylosoxidans]
MNIDLIQLIKSALIHARCGDRLTEELDPHAPIELHFGSAPIMRVARTDDDAVQLLSRLSEQPGIPGGCNAIGLLEALSAPAPWASHHGLSLLDMDGYLCLQAIVDAQFLQDGEAFSVALAAFYDRLVVIHRAFNG